MKINHSVLLGIILSASAAMAQQSGQIKSEKINGINYAMGVTTIQLTCDLLEISIDPNKMPSSNSSILNASDPQMSLATLKSGAQNEACDRGGSKTGFDFGPKGQYVVVKVHGAPTCFAIDGTGSSRVDQRACSNIKGTLSFRAPGNSVINQTTLITNVKKVEIPLTEFTQATKAELECLRQQVVEVDYLSKGIPLLTPDLVADDKSLAAKRKIAIDQDLATENSVFQIQVMSNRTGSSKFDTYSKVDFQNGKIVTAALTSNPRKCYAAKGRANLIAGVIKLKTNTSKVYGYVSAEETRQLIKDLELGNDRDDMSAESFGYRP